MLDVLSLYLNTVRFLRFRQIIWRFIYMIYRPKIKEVGCLQLDRWKTLAIPPIKKRKSFLGDGKFTFLSKDLDIKKTGWHNETYEKLWMYNLNYFDFLLQGLTKVEEREVLDLLTDWGYKNKDGLGIPWEPYPTSIRIVNILKWVLSGNDLPVEVKNNLIYQIQYLSRKIEWHIDGNHLLANAKALIFAGFCFNGSEADRWRKKGHAILFAELQQQILDDGAHFELSPMYQSILLEDLIDILNLYRANSKDTSNILLLEEYISKMLGWLLNLTHPDGKISHFNDASMDASIRPHELLDYARRLGVSPSKTDHSQCILTSSGFVKSALGETYLVVDAGDIGASYQPGHAHADTACFELSIFGKRVFVNTGISTYERGPRRLKERGTSSHNSVEINDRNSSQVWASFRVGRRAKIIKKNVHFEPNKTDITILHNGYSNIFGNPVHERHYVHEIDKLKIIDTVHGNFKKACGSLHVHPNIMVSSLVGNEIVLKGTEIGHAKVYFDNCDVQIHDYLFCTDFGKVYDSKCIKYHMRDAPATVLIKWFKS